MTKFPAKLTLLATITTATAVTSNAAHAQSLASDTVLVAPPTGERAADRASIEAALGDVDAGGTVLFAPGTYVVGEFIRVSVPRITLQGHAEGTTLRGCDPADFEDVQAAMVACSGLAMTGQRQTVRGLTFEHAWGALHIGCCLDRAEEGEAVEPSHVGGHLVEGNIFRASVNGFRVIGDSPEPVVIRDNDFVNVWHAGGVNGRTAHILDNRISVPDASQVPPNGFPGLALFITPYDTRLERAFTCAGSVIAGNQIEGHPEGIAIAVFRSGASCQRNVVRDNTIAVSRVRFSGSPWGVLGIRDEADSTLAGVPITLADLRAEMAEFLGMPDEPGGENLIHDNLIESNRIVGGEGLGIEVLRASSNRIAENTITGIAVRDPFPGNTMYVPPAWSHANGSGIWVSPGSDENEIVGNTFEYIAADAVVLEGDSNVAVVDGKAGAVRDIGEGNRISRRSRSERHATLSDSILALTRGLAEAWIRLDPDDFLSRFSDDLVFYYEGTAWDRATFEAVVRGAMASLESSTFEILDPEVEILGPDAAVISFRMRELMTGPGDLITDFRGALTLVYERRDGKWLVVRAHESSPAGTVPPPQSVSEPDTAQVLSAAEAFLAAFNNLDWEAFHASFAPSATVFQPFREPGRNEGRESIAAFFGGLFEEIRSSTEGPPYMDITPRDLRIEMLDDAGIVTFHLPGRETVGRRTLVFGRQQPTDPWRLFHLHASSLERPESREAGGPAARDLESGTAARYAGRYATRTGDGPRLTVVFRPADGGLEAELGGNSRALRYLGGHAFQDVESGFLFVFNVERDGQATGITGLSPELDRVEVFDPAEEKP